MALILSQADPFGETLERSQSDIQQSIGRSIEPNGDVARGGIKAALGEFHGEHFPGSFQGRLGQLRDQSGRQVHPRRNDRGLNGIRTAIAYVQQFPALGDGHHALRTLFELGKCR